MDACHSPRWTSSKHLRGIALAVPAETVLEAVHLLVISQLHGAVLLWASCNGILHYHYHWLLATLHVVKKVKEQISEVIGDRFWRFGMSVHPREVKRANQSSQA